MQRYIKAARYPVWAAWAYVVAKKQGYHDREAKSLAIAVANLNAASKFYGPVGNFYPHLPKRDGHTRSYNGAVECVELLGRRIPVTIQNGEYVAVLRSKGKPRLVSPDDFDRKVIDRLGSAYRILIDLFEQLADRFTPAELNAKGYKLYAENFAPTKEENGAPVWDSKGRPVYPGRGVAGIVDLERIRRLAEKTEADAYAYACV